MKKMKTKTPALKDFERRIVELRAIDEAPENQMIIEGYAIVCDSPSTVAYEDRSFTEVISKGALDNTDISDVVLRYNHNDTWLIMARTRNKSLQLIKDEKGLKIRAVLIDTESNRDIYKSIKAGLIDRMSFAFIVAKGGDIIEQNDENTTRTITNIERLCDVAVVDTPFYDSTSIYARSFDLLDYELKGLDCPSEREKLKLKLKMKGKMYNENQS